MTAPSYRELARIPGLLALGVSVFLSRWVLDGALPVSLVLTSLRLYGSPAIAGLVVFLATFPGLLLTPFAGALLDRRGRVAFIRIDLVVATAGFIVVAALAASGRLGAPILCTVAALLSCTRPLAQAGARAQVPSMTPERSWDHVNAIDTAIFTAVALTAPATAAALFGVIGPAGVFVTGAAILAASGIGLARVPETGVVAATASIWRETQSGVSYFVRNRTLVALSISSALLNVAPGTVVVVLPLLVVRHLHQSSGMLAAVFVVEQLGGMVALFAAGRAGTRGREVPVMIASAAVTAAGLLVVLVGQSLAAAFAGMVLVGAGNGPYWVALYGLRQRSTTPRMFARAFALSYACNVAGMPLGSAVAGAVSSAAGIGAALGVAALCPLLAIGALGMVPATREPIVPAGV